ncbi:homocysteine S-methyltransferase [Phytohabitans aurantiacus]|uniref:homocysteine S-methyltransferase n=1 Tax=Phytohabitans aurantiacus TaxID=3016789 RepID=UPI00249266E1|nr:homocysteine S-methyltransferase [Phytohabitans aurantiacus]
MFSDRVLVLDGGLSNQLTAQGHDLSDELWSARLLRDDPEAIVEAHLAYFLAGASVAITSSYQATFEGFAKHGIDRDETARLLRRSVALGREAVERARARGIDRPLWVAASVGPYGAMLADGSEYRGRYGLGVDALEAFHRPRMEVLAEAGPDLLAVETIPDVDEARALVRIIGDLGVPAWLTYSVGSDRTRAGQPLDEAFALAADVPAIVGVGVNCCLPEDVEAAVGAASRAAGKPVVVYPNSGESWDASARAWRGRSTFDPERVSAWRAAGARLIGGCCRVGPDQITQLAAALEDADRDA